MLLASRGSRSGKPLNVLHPTVHRTAPTTGEDPALNVSSIDLEDLALDKGVLALSLLFIHSFPVTSSA